MNLIFDVLVLVVFSFCLWHGHKSGFIKSFFGLFGSIAAFIASSLFARPIGTFLGEKVISPVMEKYLLTALSERIGTAAENLDFSALPPSCNDILSRFGVSAEGINEMLTVENSAMGQSAVEQISEAVIRPVSVSVGYAIAYIVLFIVLSVAIRFAVKALDLVAKLPVLNFSNKALGIVMGAAWGLFLAIILSGVLLYLEPAMKGSEYEVLNTFDVEQTYLIRFFSKIDLLGIFAVK